MNNFVNKMKSFWPEGKADIYISFFPYKNEEIFYGVVLLTSVGLWIVAIYIKESSLWHQLDRNQKLPFPFFKSWSPSSPYVSWFKLFPAVWTMAEKRKEDRYQKNLSRQQLVCAATLMQLLRFGWKSLSHPR